MYVTQLTFSSSLRSCSSFRRTLCEASSSGKMDESVASTECTVRDSFSVRYVSYSTS